MLLHKFFFASVVVLPPTPGATCRHRGGMHERVNGRKRACFRIEVTAAVRFVIPIRSFPRRRVPTSVSTGSQRRSAARTQRAARKLRRRSKPCQPGTLASHVGAPVRARSPTTTTKVNCETAIRPSNAGRIHEPPT